MFQDFDDEYKPRLCEDPTTVISTETDSDLDGSSLEDGDCDDASAAVYPGATEACDSVDNDCDGDTDEAGATGETTWYQDADSDGVGNSALTEEACDQPSGYTDSANGEDCDDNDAGKQEEADCATSSTRDPNCDYAVGDLMTNEVPLSSNSNLRQS